MNPLLGWILCIDSFSLPSLPHSPALPRTTIRIQPLLVRMQLAPLIPELGTRTLTHNIRIGLALLAL